MENIKNRLDRDSVSLLLERSGFEIDRHYKFRLREERTPSAVINTDGTVHDFGDDFHGDVFDVFMKYKGMTFPGAKEFVQNTLGISGVIETVFVPVRRMPLPAELTDERYRQIVADVGRFNSSGKQTFKDEGYEQSVLSIAPMWVYKQAQNVDIQLFREFATYDEDERSIVLEIRDYAGKLISYKHRYKGSIKWCTASGTHPNKQCMISIHKQPDSLYPIYVVEGARDFLMMVLMGMNVVAIPTVNYKEWTQNELSIFTRDNVVLMPDLDENNMTGVECMRNLGKQIDDVSKSVNVIDVRKMLDLMEIEHTETKIDFSDVVNLWDQHITAIGIEENTPCNTLNAFKSTLLYVSDMGTMFEKEIF